VRRIGAAALLGTACTIWSAWPLGGTGTLGVLLVVVAGGCVFVGVLRLLALSAPVTVQPALWSAWSTLLGPGRSRARGAGWESAAVVAVVALEALHHSRPWHTGLLAVVVVCYLFAVREAESPAPVAVLRSEVRGLIVGLPLIAVAAGVAMLPRAASGTTSGWLEVVAALAAIAAGALALPL
jgi:hypothetical protein